MIIETSVNVWKTINHKCNNNEKKTTQFYSMKLCLVYLFIDKLITMLIIKIFSFWKKKKKCIKCLIVSHILPLHHLLIYSREHPVLIQLCIYCFSDLLVVLRLKYPVIINMGL